MYRSCDLTCLNHIIHGADAAPAVCWTPEVFVLNGKKKTKKHWRLDKVLTEQVVEEDKSKVG